MHHSPLLRRGGAGGVGSTANLYERVLTLAGVAPRARSRARSRRRPPRLMLCARAPPAGTRTGDTVC